MECVWNDIKRRDYSTRVDTILETRQPHFCNFICCAVFRAQNESRRHKYFNWPCLSYRSIEKIKSNTHANKMFQTLEEVIQLYGWINYLWKSYSIEFFLFGLREIFEKDIRCEELTKFMQLNMQWQSNAVQLFYAALRSGVEREKRKLCPFGCLHVFSIENVHTNKKRILRNFCKAGVKTGSLLYYS